MEKSRAKARRARVWGWTAVVLLFCGLCWSLGLRYSRPDRVVVNPATSETLKGSVQESSRRTEFLSYVAREVEVLKEREGKVPKELRTQKSKELSDCRHRIQRVETEMLRARRSGAFSERLILETRQELSSIAESLVALEP